jgi:DNA-binding LacI/PurR family transcriptional regulator
MDPAKTDINGIARAAGVSTTTVSNYINATETIPISAEKQARIRDAMRRARYRPNSASSLLRRKRELPGIGVLVFGNWLLAQPYELLRHPMLGQLLAELDRTSLQRLGLRLEVRAVPEVSSLDCWNNLLIDAQYVLSYGFLHYPLHHLCERKNIPLVAIGETPEQSLREGFPSPPLVDRVYWDASRHLRANHPVGFAVEAEAKMDAFRAYLAEHPDMTGEIVSPPRVPDDLDIYHESRGACELLRARPDLLAGADAILGHNDIVAQGVVAALLEHGRRPGRDVLVTGEGDFAECRHLLPAVTTIAYDRAAAVEQVVGLIGRRQEDNIATGANLAVPSRLLVRDTA